MENLFYKLNTSCVGFDIFIKDKVYKNQYPRFMLGKIKNIYGLIDTYAKKFYKNIKYTTIVNINNDDENIYMEFYVNKNMKYVVSIINMKEAKIFRKFNTSNNLEIEYGQDANKLCTIASSINKDRATLYCIRKDIEINNKIYNDEIKKYKILKPSIINEYGNKCSDKCSNKCSNKCNNKCSKICNIM